MHSSAILSLLLLFSCDVAVGAGESDERDQSVPAQTAPQQAGFGSYPGSACWLSVLFVVVLGGDMGYPSWFGKGIQHPTYNSAACYWYYCDAPGSSTAYWTRKNRAITFSRNMHLGTVLTKCISEASFRVISSKQTGIQTVSKRGNANTDTAAAQGTQHALIATPSPAITASRLV